MPSLSYEEMRREIISYPIEQYAVHLGFTPVHKGSNYVSLREHDSVMINTSTNLFTRFSQRNGSKASGGSVIDFAIMFDDSMSGKSSFDVIKELYKYVSGQDFLPVEYGYNYSQKNHKGPLEIPKRVKGVKHVYSYLLTTRKISKNIVDWFLKERMLFEDEHNNCVFVSYSKGGKAEFCCLRGTNTYKKFVSEAKGCNYDRCFAIDAKNSDTLIVTEAVIDMMSLMTLMENNGEDVKKYSYQALGSCSKIKATLKYVENNPNITAIKIAFDNDEAGITWSQGLCEALVEKGFDPLNIEVLIPPEEHGVKDWNDYLKNKDLFKVNYVRKFCESKTQNINSKEIEVG